MKDLLEQLRCMGMCWDARSSLCNHSTIGEVAAAKIESLLDAAEGRNDEILKLRKENALLKSVLSSDRMKRCPLLGDEHEVPRVDKGNASDEA